MALADYLIEIYYSGAWHSVAAYNVLEASGSWEISGNRQNAVSFGDDTDASMTARFTYGMFSSFADKMPIRYTTTIDADTTRTFTGVITRTHRTLDDCDIAADGMKVLIAATKTYSPMYARRHVATHTSATSIDDPSLSTYAGGIINYMLWQAGGRPYEQSGSYPSATFYYSCNHAILAPDYSWTAGEDSWAECLKAAQASGGQMYQDASGVVRYKQILGYAGGTPSETLDESDYATIEETTDPDITQGTKFTCQYVPRRRLGTQEIANDTTPYHVEPGESQTIVIEPQNPIMSLETQAADPTQLRPEAMIIALQDGTRISQGSGYTHTLTVAAARITIVVTNAGSKAFTIYRVILRGDPVVAAEAGSVTSGSGTIERVLEQSPYVQSRDHAQRLIEMHTTFYGAARPSVSVGGVVHKPSRAVGDTIELTNSAWSMSAVAHVITAIEHSETGIQDDLECAYVDDLPDASLFFIVGTSYSGADARYLGW